MKLKQFKILLLFLLFASTLHAQVSESEYKAAFIERFTRFVEWPNEIESELFKIVVIGKDPINESLANLFADEKIKGKSVEISYTNNIEYLANANLVFIASSEKKRIKDIIAFTDKSSILTIGDSKGFCAKGVHINMYVDEAYIRYEINQIAIEKSNLKVSSLLLASAKIVKTDD